jgi:peptide/nickel transport system permease protein
LIHDKGDKVKNHLTPEPGGEKKKYEHEFTENKTIAVIIRLWKNSKGSFGMVVLLVLIALAVFDNQIAPYDPIELHLKDKLQPPNATYWFGTDELGRDILSRIIHGTDVALEAGLFAVLIGAFVGVTTGVIAGYIGGSLDTIIMRWWDTILAFPAIFKGIALAAVLGAGPVVAMLAVAFTTMPTFSRLTRSIAISVKDAEFVAAEQALGASDWSIMFKSILPNCLTPVLVNMALAAPSAILIEASLSFLGLGSQPPDPTWGNMLRAAQGYLRQVPTYAIFPGIFITLVVLGLNFFADGLQDAIDPRRIRAARRG